MASESTSDLRPSHPSLFDVPELVDPIAQYLSHDDIVRCMATCKAWAHLFEPFLWQKLDLSWLDPVPQTLARNRHWIRSLNVAFNDYTNLLTLADDLPDLLPSGPDSSRELCSSAIPSTTENSFFPRLRTVRFHLDYEAYHDTYELKDICCGYVVRVLNQCPGLTQITITGEFLEPIWTNQDGPGDYIQGFLNALAYRLPSLRRLEFQYHPVMTDIAVKLLRVCFNHPQLVNLNCQFHIGDEDSLVNDAQELDELLKALEDDKQAREACGNLAVGNQTQEMVLPKAYHGYPLNFIYALLKYHLPNLERFEIPDIHEGDGDAYRDSLREAVAQGCPKLQHIRCSWFEGDETIIGIIEGCREWGLKSLCCEGLDDLNGCEEGHRFMETLVMDHFRTLEEVELMNCQGIHEDDLVSLFSTCRNLKKVKISAGSRTKSTMEFRDVALREWVCHDLKELQLVMSESRRVPELTGYDSNETGSEDDSDDDGDDGGDSGGGGDGDNNSEDSDSRRQRAEDRMRLGKEAYRQIGRLAKLETLCLDCYEHEDPDGAIQDYEYDLTMERGWLGELAGLKELRHLHMAADFWTRIGQAEVEFMHAQWPKLEMITVRTSRLESVYFAPHWEWLRRKRPRFMLESNWKSIFQ